MRPDSLRFRMTAAFALAFAALTLAAIGFVLWFARHTSEKTADAALQAGALQLREESADTRRLPDSDGWVEEWEDYTRQNLALVSVDAQGQARPRTPGRVPPVTSGPPGSEWRVRPIPLDSGTLVIGYYWQPVENGLRRLTLTLSLVGFGLFAAATVGAWVLVGRTLSPIYRLSLQAEAAAERGPVALGRVPLRLEAPSRDSEMVHLVGTLNALLRRLATAMSARERFYAAASHELRTPLQTLTGYLEMALMQPRGADAYREYLEESHAQGRRLTSLVQALLLLNQLERAARPRVEAVDLAEMWDRLRAQFREVAGERSVVMDWRGPDALPLAADPSYLEILLRNVLENAVKYAAPGTTIALQAETPPGGGILVSVSNTCATPPTWDDDKIFEPFYRPDASRNSDTGGNGLGLAICKAVTDAAGWDIRLLRRGNDVTARLWFPPG